MPKLSVTQADHPIESEEITQSIGVYSQEDVLASQELGTALRTEAIAAQVEAELLNVARDAKVAVAINALWDCPYGGVHLPNFETCVSSAIPIAELAAPQAAFDNALTQMNGAAQSALMSELASSVGQGTSGPLPTSTGVPVGPACGIS